MPILSLFGSPVQGIIDEQGIVDDTARSRRGFAIWTGYHHPSLYASRLLIRVTEMIHRLHWLIHLQRRERIEEGCAIFGQIQTSRRNQPQLVVVRVRQEAAHLSRNRLTIHGAS